MDLELLKTIDLEKISTLASSKELNILLVNMLEVLLGSNERLAKELQELKDEINRLKGQQGKPIFKPNKE